MFYESFGTRNPMMAFNSKFDPMKDQCQIKLGQISKLFFPFKNMPILSSFVSGFQKCQLFLCTTIKNVKKMRFKK